MSTRLLLAATALGLAQHVVAAPPPKAVLFRPEKTATTFGSQVNAGGDACMALARAKLKEAVDSVVSSLVKA